MLRWQERVLEERADLLRKLIDLKAFLHTQKAKGIPITDRNLLMAQCAVMQQYKDILDRRIANFDE